MSVNSVGDQSTLLARRMSALADVPLFEALKHDLEGLNFLASLVEERNFDSGKVIFREGEPGTELFILTRGKIGIYKKTLEGEEFEVAVADPKSQHFFGEGGLLDSDMRSATLRAEVDSRTLVLDQVHFELFCKKFPHLGVQVLQKIAQAVMVRMRRTNADLMMLYQALIAEIRGN